MRNLLSQEQIESFKSKAKAIAHPHELIVDMLRAIQAFHGWVPDEGIFLTAETLEILPIEVEEVATFYDKIFRYPVGQKVIHVCDSICCWANGSEMVMEHLQKTLNIGLGQTSLDGMFTLLPTCCLGACGEAPAMMIGLTIHGQLTPQKINEILASEKATITAEE